MNRTWEAFLRLIYPATCGVCQELLELEEEGLCRPCQAKLKTLRYAPEDSILSEKFEALDGGWVLYPYDSPVKEILSAIKFAKKRWLIRVFEEELKELSQALGSEARYDYLIPVPMDRHRLLEREFNQSELIARLTARHLKSKLAKRFLKKRRKTKTQSSLKRTERRTNMNRAFKVPWGQSLSGKHILLVDDIFTTGATAEEAARELKKSGARQVDVLALARTKAPE